MNLGANAEKNSVKTGAVKAFTGVHMRYRLK